jgi:hypothetical protein
MENSFGRFWDFFSFGLKYHDKIGKGKIWWNIRLYKSGSRLMFARLNRLEKKWYLWNGNNNVEFIVCRIKINLIKKFYRYSYNIEKSPENNWLR